MKERMIKTVAVDLDGTLLHSDKTISTETRAVLAKCKKQGIRLLVATARPLRTIESYCRMVDFDALVVSNGARVVCREREILHGLQPESARRLLTILKCYPDMRVTLETLENAYSNKPIEDYQTDLREDLVGVAGEEVILKIIVHMDTPETADLVQKALTDELYVSVSGGYMMQIMDKSASKWNGIRTVLDVMGGSPEETAYFGDDHDDVMPIKMCGLGIAVANAIDEVKDAAAAVTLSNDADGVANFIEKLLGENQ